MSKEVVPRSGGEPRLTGKRPAEQVDLRAMVKAGLLHVHGSKRTTTYTAGEDVAIAAASVRHDRQPISADELFPPDTELREPTLPLGE